MRVERITGLVAALLGAALVAASLRLVPAALHRDAAQAAFARAVAADRPSPRDVAALERHSAAALAQHGTPADRRRLAAAAHLRGETERARRHLRQTLSHAPADAVAWTRLAALRYHAGAMAESAQALAHALRMAPAMRRLAPLRGQLVLRLWPHLSTTDVQRHGLRQLRFALQTAPKRIARAAARANRRHLLTAANAGAPRRR